MAKSRSLSLVEASASKCGEISTIKCVLLGLLGADRSFSLSTMRRASVSIRLSCKAVTWALAVRSRIGQQLLFIQRLGIVRSALPLPKKRLRPLSALPGQERQPMCNLIARFWDVNAGKITIGGTLSGGEKQRISIARAMLKDAPIIILDEATSSVDPENEDELQRAIEALTHDKTIIMIAHRLKTVRNADQILVLDNAHIVQRGTHAELIQQKGLYADFVSARQEAIGWKLAQ